LPVFLTILGGFLAAYFLFLFLISNRWWFENYLINKALKFWVLFLTI
jgi:hypothetical protein